MAVSVLDRPYGLLNDTSNPISSNIYKSSDPLVGASGNNAAILEIGHGLVDFDRIYIKSSCEEYNGFWYVNQISVNVFYISRTININDLVQHIKDAEITYYVCTQTKWSCVHLPIIYKLSSSLWPTNSADTVRTISTVADSGEGYCDIVASGDIKATGAAAALEFVKITGATDDDLNGVWQIISYSNDTEFILDIPYTAANDAALTGASIQYYYNNYHIKVQVWGGLNNGHTYYAQEPYELLATLSLIPDENGVCQFSIHEILKKNIAIKNNLLLGTLPNNLDAWTGFFIKYCEVHDDSDGTTLSTLTESFTSDLTNFEGYAVNAILPFKNVYSGALSEYISGDENQKFLTPFTRPTIFSGKYFDLSLLWEGVNDIFYKLEWYLKSVLQTTTYSDFFDGFYTGVYRGQVTADCDYDRLDVTSYKAFGIPRANVWKDDLGLGDAFTKTATVLSLSDASAPISAADAYIDLSLAVGDVITFEITFTIGGTFSGGSGGRVSFFLYDSTGSGVVDTESITGLAAGTYTETVTLTPSSASDRLYIESGASASSGSFTADITVPVIAKLIKSTHIVSETKTLDIDCKCVKSKATGYYLSWLNYLGGFDYWYFTEYADHIIDITESGETEENIFPNWPNSYGEFSDTIRKQTFKKSRRQIVVRSQNLTLAQLQAIEYIKTSPLVQIVNSIYDRRTVLVDSDSFTSYREGQKEQYTISFTITYTDDVPSQTV